jgi:hypothetical protein
MVGCGGGGGGCGGFRGVGGSCQVDVVEEVAVVVGCLTSKSAQTNASACSRRSEPDDAGRLAAANYCEFREGNEFPETAFEEYGKRIKAEKNFLFFFFFFFFLKGIVGFFGVFALVEIEGKLALDSADSEREEVEVLWFSGIERKKAKSDLEG